jgi:hypothetical protein
MLNDREMEFNPNNIDARTSYLERASFHGQDIIVKYLLDIVEWSVDKLQYILRVSTNIV